MGVPSNEGALKLNPTIPIDQSIYEESTTKKAQLGTKLEVGERTFRYAKAGATGLGVKAGQVCCSVIDLSLHGGTYVSFAVATTGATTLYATATGTFAANVFDDGFVVFGGGTRAGEVYKVKSHGTGVAAVPFVLYDPIVGTVTATSLGAIIPSKYVMEVSTAGQGPAGVSMIDVTAGNYFWAQVKGPAGVIAAATPGPYSALTIGTTGNVINYVAVTTINSTSPCVASTGGIQIGWVGDAAGVADKATPVILMLE